MPSAKPLEGGLSQAHDIGQMLRDSDITGLSTTSLTANSPFGYGVIDDGRNDNTVRNLEQCNPPTGVPGWNTGKLPNTQNCVIAFYRFSKDAAYVNASDVNERYNKEGLTGVQMLIDSWQYEPPQL